MSSLGWCMLGLFVVALCWGQASPTGGTAAGMSAAGCSRPFALLTAVEPPLLMPIPWR